MGQRLVPVSVVLLLLVGAVVLPMAISLLFGLGRLLAAMGDAQGGAVMGWISLAAGVVWTLDLVALVLVQTINSLGENRQNPQDRNG